jgi:hypothetical protein
MTWKMFMEPFGKFLSSHPFSSALGTPKFFLTDSPIVVHILQTYLLLWAYFGDAIAGLVGQKKK